MHHSFIKCKHRGEPGSLCWPSPGASHGSLPLGASALGFYLAVHLPAPRSSQPSSPARVIQSVSESIHGRYLTWPHVVKPDSFHKVSVLCPQRTQGNVFPTSSALAVRRQTSDLSICLQRTFVEQVVQSSLQGLRAGLCCGGCAGMDLLAPAALVAPLWDVEHRTPWPVTVGGWWDIKAP